MVGKSLRFEWGRKVRLGKIKYITRYFSFRSTIIKDSMELNGPCCGTVEIAYLIADGIYIKHGTMLPNDADVIFSGGL